MDATTTPKICIGFVDGEGRGVTREHRDARPCGHVLMDPVPGFDTYYCEGCGRAWQPRYVEEAEWAATEWAAAADHLARYGRKVTDYNANAWNTLRAEGMAPTVAAEFLVNHED